MIRVIAGCTHRAGLLPQYETQLAEGGVELRLETNPDLAYPGGLRMLGAHVENLRRWVDKHGDCDGLVFSDAWDVLFYGTAEDVERKIPEKGVLLAGEKNCWPDSYLAHAYRDDSPWKFVNGGLLAGKPKEIAAWLDEVEAHPAYHPAVMDQQWFNHRRLDTPDLIPVDLGTDLFYCMCLESGELVFDNGLPTNSVMGTQPNYLHFNGKADPSLFLLKQGMSKMGLL